MSDPLDEDTDPDTLAVRARHNDIPQDELPINEALLAQTVRDRQALLAETLRHGIEQAIDFTDDMEASEIADALAQAGVAEQDLPHIHNWADVLGSGVTIADQRFCTYRCACGEEKVDRWRG